MTKVNVLRILLVVIGLVLIVLNILEEGDNSKLCIALGLITIANVIRFVHDKDKKEGCKY